MRVILIWLTIALAAAGCQSNPEPATDSSIEKQPFLTIATGGISGPYYKIGGALAKVYKDKLNYHAAVRSTDGSVENVNLLKNDKADLAFAMSDVASFALHGQENFHATGPNLQFKSIAGLYLNYVQIVTLKDRHIDSVQDLKGKRVGVGAPNSGVEVNARMILEVHGITYHDLKPEYLSYAEAIEQLKNNTIDAAFVTSGLPNPAVLDLQKSNKVMIVPIESSILDELNKQYPFFVKAEIPEGIYQNTQRVSTVAIRNILLVRSDLPDTQVYRLTKTLFENLDILQEAHEAANTIDKKTAGQNLVVPLHPGAEKYYRE